eukprot:1159555-Pelagomonas_calceolata.AAC.6
MFEAQAFIFVVRGGFEAPAFAYRVHCHHRLNVQWGQEKRLTILRVHAINYFLASKRETYAVMAYTYAELANFRYTEPLSILTEGKVHPSSKGIDWRKNT